jgi:outer membrane protein assembly factor BamB
MEDSPVYAHGFIYIATSNGILNAYRATTGALKWSFNSNSSFPNFSAPLVDPVNNLVFFGTIGYEDSGIPSPFYALNAQNGKLVWSMIIPWNDFGFPSLHFGTIYVGNSHEAGNGSLYAIDELTGALKWSYATNGGVWGSVAADVGTNTVFTSVGNPSNSVIALDATTGIAKWTYVIPNSNGDDDPGSAISVSNGLIYVDSKIGSVYAIHEADGTLAWQTAIGTPNIGNVSSLAIANGVAYVGSLDTNLYALDATTGAVLWKTPAGKGIQSSPAYANGIVFFTSLDGKLYAVNATTGAIRVAIPLGAKSYSSPIVVNGWVYCSATDGKVYGFSL